MYFRLEVVHYLANSEVTHNHRQSLQHFSLYMLLLPHHSSAAQRRPTNKPLCKQMSHDMFVCCAESSRQVICVNPSLVLSDINHLFGKHVASVGSASKTSKISFLLCRCLHMRDLASLDTFFTSCKRILPTHSVCMRDGQKLAVHLMPSFLFCCLHMSDLDKLDTY